MNRARRRLQTPNILHVDSQVLVVDKPSGVLLTRGRGENVGLPDLLGGHGGLPEDEPFRIVHRLHEQASGVVVYARTPAAGSNLTGQFAGGQAETTYLALVSGYIECDGEINIALHYDKRTGKLRASRRRGNPVLTRYSIVERVAGNTLLECRPVEERGDQVRVHLAAIGHPLTVDVEFGGGRALLLSDYKPGYRPSGRHTERPLVERLTLHAGTVSFRHPETDASMRFTAPLPKDLRATLVQLRRLG